MKISKIDVERVEFDAHDAEESRFEDAEDLIVNPADSEFFGEAWINGFDIG